MMRVVTYHTAGHDDPDKLGRALAELDPDVVFLLGLPGRRGVKMLLRVAGLDLVVRAGKRRVGSAILARPGAHVRSRERVALTAVRRRDRREAAHAIVSIGGITISATAVMFGLRPDVRAANLDEIRSWLSTVAPPGIIGASLNDSISSPVGDNLAQAYQDAFAVAGTGVGDTYPALDPIARRDFIFVDHRLAVTRCVVPTGTMVELASRHRPVVAEIGEIRSADVESAE
jgi:endonuclease/exonuclease/phosphatase family metal-dependent hydrolase